LPESSVDAWGVQANYLDSADVARQVPPAAVERLRTLVGQPPPDHDRTAPIVTGPGRPAPDRGEVHLETGGTLALAEARGTRLPIGYHTLVADDGSVRDLIVSPRRCHEAPGRAWGWAVQLYAARSRASWGIGELADLARLGEWASRSGAGFLLVNPLHAVALAPPQEPSPYFPSSRRFGNPIYLRVEDVPGAEQVDVGPAAQAGRDLNASPRIDRDAVWRIKRPVLEAIFATVRPDEQFERWRAEQGDPLEQFATWCALADEYGPRWREWPAALRRPGTKEVAQFAQAAAGAVDFHAWLQWQLACQQAAASDRLSVVQDLPIGFDPHGADAWAWQDLIAFDATVGAPPDPFNLQGQNWGLPPFVPWRLRQAGYRPFIDSIRATIATGGGLRIDHVMGLFRLWWIPTDAPATEGGYVRYPAEDLLDIVALESARAKAVVVGEDLGTVEAGVREAMQAAGLLSYRLLWFEDERPARWPEPAMAAVTTHDLPTVAGLWTGADLRDQAVCGVLAAEEDTERLRDKLAATAGLAPDAPVEDAVEGAYRALAEAPSRLLTATLEDALAVDTRPNMPGTTDRPNWSVALPVPIEELDRAPGPAAIADALSRAG
jgi:4-alpha-glucanotransferase